MAHVRSFAPIAFPGSRVLVLGSMPGTASLKVGRYYAHPRNAFWPIMGALFGAGPDKPYEERLVALEAAGVAVWDSLQACFRPGSLDTAISEEVANDFPAFFAEHPGITHVFFNGAKSEAVFRRHVLPLLGENRRFLIRLPSTSPAHAGMSLERKIEAWRAVADALCA